MTSVRRRKNTTTSNTNTLAKLMEKEFSNTSTTLSTTKATMASLLGTAGAAAAAQQNTCKALILKGDSAHNKSNNLSYFLNINFLNRKKSKEGFTKVRIKIPRLLVKTVKPVKKKEDPNNISTDDDAKKQGRNLVSNRVTSLLSKPFVSKKPDKVSEALALITKLENISSLDRKGTSSSSPLDTRRSNASRTGEEFGSQRWEIDGYSKTASEYSESFRTTSVRSAYSDVLSNSPLSEIPQDLEVVDMNNKGDQGKVCPTCRRALEPESSSIKSLITKTTPMKFIKGRYGSSNSSSSSTSISSTSVLSCYGKDAESKGSSSRRFTWNPSSLGRKVNTDKEEEEEADKELCKKKILMGERCRPLDDDSNGFRKTTTTTTGGLTTRSVDG